MLKAFLYFFVVNLVFSYLNSCFNELIVNYAILNQYKCFISKIGQSKLI